MRPVGEGAKRTVFVMRGTAIPIAHLRQCGAAINGF